MIVLQENGLLLSCAYDKTVIVWKYQEEREITRFKKPEELRCMDYLSSTKTLFVGTNQKSIITIPIDDLLSENVDLIFGQHEDDDESQFRTSMQSQTKMIGGAGVFSPSQKHEVEEEIEAMLRNKQGLLDKLQLDDNDPLKKLLSNHDQIVKMNQGGK